MNDNLYLQCEGVQLTITGATQAGARTNILAFVISAFSAYKAQKGKTDLSDYKPQKGNADFADY